MELVPRVAGIVVRDEEILLVNHREPGYDYWVPPGGSLEPGEGMHEGVCREVMEETGLEVEVSRMLYYDD